MDEAYRLDGRRRGTQAQVSVGAVRPDDVNRPADGPDLPESRWDSWMNGGFPFGCAPPPLPPNVCDPPSSEFLREIRLLIRAAVEKGGGRLEGLASMAATTA